jgi:uncharacterized membrane protein YheB (UPF0754 family)
LGKFTNSQRDHLRQLIVESEIQRFNRTEAKTYIESKIGQEISYESIDKQKAQIKRKALGRINKFKTSRTAFIDQYFQRIDEILKYQQEQWRIYNQHGDKPFLQKLCLQELHALTVTLTSLYDALPGISEYIAYTTLPKDKQMVLREDSQEEADTTGLSN